MKVDTKIQNQSSTSGGTSHTLPLERAKASFNIEALKDFLNGGADMTKRRKFIQSVIKEDPNSSYSDRNNFSRDHLKEVVQNFIH